jgi:uncharacterized protein
VSTPNDPQNQQPQGQPQQQPPYGQQPQPSQYGQQPQPPQYGQPQYNGVPPQQPYGYAAPPPPAYDYSAAPPPIQPSEEKSYAILTHVLSIFFGWIPALIMFLIYRQRGPFIRAHVVTEWNFQLTVLIADAAGLVILLIGYFITIGSVVAISSQGSEPTGLPAGAVVGFIILGLGYFVLVAVRIIAIVFGIIASIRANRGQFYQYPLAFRFVKA